ncbi:DUF3806 domain-containing protein [Teredinibacter franksiae]|uniref:DUF3806 domain-containing protein n=1 Tax=Teredinibacter franksiae TaxID=2761453 RepID=UPI001623B39D|nr:DUF3806 domain-containing protein [Teredinibacter franksiae]
MKYVLLPILALLSLHASANDADVASKVLAKYDDGPSVRELNWLNQNFMDSQRKTVNTLIATHYGKRLRGNILDIPVLQRLVTEDVIPKDDTAQLQALGVALGDILVHETADLEWVVYEDDLGSTQAVCIKDSVNCLFPITMLSRRMEVGLKPDVNRVYSKAVDSVKPFLPKTPYTIAP